MADEFRLGLEDYTMFRTLLKHHHTLSLSAAYSLFTVPFNLVLPPLLDHRAIYLVFYV
jgi:hypothetical protein